MSDQETIRGVVTTLVSSSKIGTAVPPLTAALSTVVVTNALHGVLVDISMFVGIVVTCLLGLIHWTKYKILKRTYDEHTTIIPGIDKE